MPPFDGHHPKSLRALGPIAAAGCLVLASAGCSVKQGENADLIAGKQQFVAKCGACHTLARAGTKGTVGPNLDEVLGESIAEAHGRSAIRGVVEYQIRQPNPFGVMPKNLVTGAAVNDVASYVAAAAARPGSDTGLLASAVKAPGGGKPAEEKSGKLQIPANPEGQLAYATNKATAAAGPVTIEMPNVSGVSHNIAIQQGSSGATEGPTPVLGASAFTTKGTASVKVALKAGTYTFFCQAPGHRAAGMWGTLTVK
ncbi:MAG TPA: plastocyanin/azurin family copper-binding protein [Solirubrobacteraceae bacterium]|nr:plastocyanin/azurin family copper-binding protein [Solirubrobacteraceae bacterium]